MKNKNLRLLKSILLLAVLSTSIMACSLVAGIHAPVVWTDQEHHGPRHHYYYYPDQNIYYDVNLSLYYWQENGSWHNGRNHPKHIVPTRRVRFKTDADRPYNVHDRVEKRFNSDKKGKNKRSKNDKRKGKK